MKSLIIYSSFHHKNTEKVAKEMAKILNADLIRTENAKVEDILNYDLIGFGSGIYFFKHHKDLFKLIKKLEPGNKKKVFIFSTSGLSNGKRYHKKLREELTKKGFEVIGEFNCPGWDTFGLLRLIGGINKNRPSKEDFENVRRFTKELLEKIK